MNIFYYIIISYYRETIALGDSNQVDSFLLFNEPDLILQVLN